MRKRQCPVALQKLWRVVGRRGLFLGFLAMLDTIIGYFLLVPPPGPPMPPFPFMSPVTWGCLWLVTGGVCAAGAFTSWDRIAFGAAAFLKAGWALRYAYLWLVTGVPYAWTSMMVWLTFAGVVLVVASWPDNIITLPSPRHGRKR